MDILVNQNINLKGHYKDRFWSLVRAFSKIFDSVFIEGKDDTNAQYFDVVSGILFTIS